MRIAREGRAGAVTTSIKLLERSGGKDGSAVIPKVLPKRVQ